MRGPENANYFLIGNVILGVALLLLLFMGRAWEALGIGALVAWVALVIAGVTFLMRAGDKKE